MDGLSESVDRGERESDHGNVEDDRMAQRPSAHRAAPIALPSDARQASALVLRYVQSGTSAFDRSAAIEAMHDRLDRLLAADGAAVDEELVAHAAVLDAMFLRFSAEAVAARDPDHRAKFVKVALAAQAGYVRTWVAVEGLRLQRRAADSFPRNKAGGTQPLALHRET